MPDTLTAFQDLTLAAKTVVILVGILAWLAGVWLLTWVREAFR